MKIHSHILKLIYFQIPLNVFSRKVGFGRFWGKYVEAFIVYMFPRPPEVFSQVGDNTGISPVFQGPARGL